MVRTFPNPGCKIVGLLKRSSEIHELPVTTTYENLQRIIEINGKIMGFPGYCKDDFLP